MAHGVSKTPCPYSPAAYVNAVLAGRRFKGEVKGAGIALLRALAEFQKDWVHGDEVFPSEIALARRAGVGSVNTVAHWRRRLAKVGLLRVRKARVRTGRLCWHYRLVLPKNIPHDDAGPAESETARYPTDRAQPSVPPAKDGALRARSARDLLEPASTEGLDSAAALRRLAGGPTPSSTVQVFFRDSQGFFLWIRPRFVHWTLWLLMGPCSEDLAS